MKPVKAKRDPGRAPSKYTILSPKLSQKEKASALLASDMVANAFRWEDHPWGYDFWNSVHQELKMLGRGL